MSRKKVLVINGNPKNKSLCGALAEAYADAAKNQHDVIYVKLSDLTFDPNLHSGYNASQMLEEDLKHLQTQISRAQHIVIVSPVWWGSMPAKLKGVFNRVLLSGYAFQYQKGNPFPAKLLEGKTAQLLFTLDTPTLWYKWIQGNPIYKQLKRTILSFVGIKTTSAHYFGPVISAKEKTIQGWLDKAERLGTGL